MISKEASQNVSRKPSKKIKQTRKQTRPAFESLIDQETMLAIRETIKQESISSQVHVQASNNVHGRKHSRIQVPSTVVQFQMWIQNL